MQHVDRPADVQSLSEPAGRRRSRVKAKPKCLVPRSQDLDGIGGHRSRRRDGGQDPAVRPAEAKLATGPSLHPVALFVDRAVVTTTEQREIRQLGRPAVNPVADVMTLAERQAAAGKAAAAVAMVEHAT